MGEDSAKEVSKTNVQVAVEQQRAVYGTLKMPFLAQMARMHRLSVRDIAGIFGISKSYAAQLLNHEKVPDLELAFRLARYFECTVDELFGWRFDDDGKRRPLMIELDRKTIRLTPKNRNHSALGLVKMVVDWIARGGDGIIPEE